MDQSATEEEVWQLRPMLKNVSSTNSTESIRKMNQMSSERNKLSGKSASIDLFNSFLRKINSKTNNSDHCKKDQKYKIHFKSKSNASLQNTTINNNNNNFRKNKRSFSTSNCKYCQARKVVMQLDEFNNSRRCVQDENGNFSFKKDSECDLCKNKRLSLRETSSSNETCHNNKITSSKNDQAKLSDIKQPSIGDKTLLETNDSTNTHVLKSNSFNLLYPGSENSSSFKNKQRQLFDSNFKNNLDINATNKRHVPKKIEKKNDQKAAKTLSAILLAFILTWTPYNINVVVNTFCDNCLDKYTSWQHFGMIKPFFSNV